jgi:hypothetical protein
MVINQKTGVIYITDTCNERVVKLDRDFSYILQWGSVDGKTSSERGEFNHPHGIDVDSKGDVYVNELENPRIQKFDENGKFVKQWGSEGKGKGEFTPLLEHLEVDSKQDRIFMVDGALNPRIQVLIQMAILPPLWERVETETVNSQNLSMLILIHQEMCMLSIGVINGCKYFLNAKIVIGQQVQPDAVFILIGREPESQLDI